MKDDGPDDRRKEHGYETCYKPSATSHLPYGTGRSLISGGAGTSFRVQDGSWRSPRSDWASIGVTSGKLKRSYLEAVKCD